MRRERTDSEEVFCQLCAVVVVANFVATYELPRECVRYGIQMTTERRLAIGLCPRCSSPFFFHCTLSYYDTLPPRQSIIRLFPPDAESIPAGVPQSVKRPYE